MSAVPGLSAVILCGGRGTRAWPLTEDLPKPLLPVGDRPALAHILDIYARQGVGRFVLAAGYKAERVREWAATSPHDVVTLDTGEDTNTGDRITACLDAVGDTFFATYGDGLGNVDLVALLADHARSGGATVTTVPLPSQYGTVVTDGSGRVTGFREKPVLPDHRINAGWFVFDRAVVGAHGGPDLERDTLPALAAAGVLVEHRHEGFWKSMDTQKDITDMNRLATEGGSPWLDLRT